MEMGREGRRGLLMPDAEPAVRKTAGEIGALVPEGAGGSDRRSCRN